MLEIVVPLHTPVRGDLHRQEISVKSECHGKIRCTQVVGVGTVTVTTVQQEDSSHPLTENSLFMNARAARIGQRTVTHHARRCEHGHLRGWKD